MGSTIIKISSAFSILGLVLAGCSKTASQPLNSIQITNSSPQSNPTQEIKTESYSLTVPKDWTVKIELGDILRFYKDGKEIGGLEIESYIPPDSVSYPGHSLFIDKKKLDGFFTDVIQITFKRQPPAASGDTNITYETDFYFLLKEKATGHPDLNKAYVLFFDRAYTSDQSMIDISKSLTLKN